MCTVTEYRDVHRILVWNIKKLKTTCWLISYDISGIWNPNQLLLIEKENARATWPFQEKKNLSDILFGGKKKDAKACVDYFHLY